MSRSFLNKPLFGPDRFRLYEELAKELGGQFTEAPSLKLKFHDWVIDLTNDAETGSHVAMAYFENPKNLQLNIRTGDILMRSYTRVLRLQNIDIEGLGPHFIVKGSPEESVKKLLSLELCDALKHAPKGQFGIQDLKRDSFPSDIAQLSFRHFGRVDAKSLRALIDVFKRALLQLFAINHPERPLLRPHDVPMLSSLKQTLERNPFTPVMERHGDGLQAPVRLEGFASFAGAQLLQEWSRSARLDTRFKR